MLRYLHSLSTVLFYLLAGGFFLAYVLFHNGIATQWAALYLYAGELPLLIISLLYGGMSVYRSLQAEGGHSRSLGLAITLPLAILFILFLIIRFGHVS